MLEVRPALDKAHEKRLPEDRVRTIFFNPRAWQTCANKRRLASSGRMTKLLALARCFRMRRLFAEKRELDTPKINIYILKSLRQMLSAEQVKGNWFGTPYLN